MAPLFPNLPPPCPIGRPKTWEWRDILDAIFYVTKQVANGEPCLVIYRPGKAFIVTFAG